MTTVRHSFDAATRVSRALSDSLEKLVNDPDREAPPTLGDVRAILRARQADGYAQREDLLQPQEEISSLSELDRLIEEYGADALAIDFVSAKASEGLPRAPTLRQVREAMLHGLTARLVGEGAIDGDEESALLAEIEDLIHRYGEHAAAETVIRFE